MSGRFERAVLIQFNDGREPVYFPAAVVEAGQATEDHVEVTITRKEDWDNDGTR